MFLMANFDRFYELKPHFKYLPVKKQGGTSIQEGASI